MGKTINNHNIINISIVLFKDLSACAFIIKGWFIEEIFRKISRKESNVLQIS